MRTNQGESFLDRQDDWPGRAIAAEARVTALEMELRGEREAYDSLRRDLYWEHEEREGELEEDAQAGYEAYYALANFVILHEPILREHYKERGVTEVGPEERFEEAMHEIHRSLIARMLELDDEGDAAYPDAGE